MKVCVNMYPELSLPIGESLYVFKTYQLFMYLSIIIGITLSYQSLKKTIKNPFMFLLGLVLSFIIGARFFNFIVNIEAYESKRISLFEFKAIGFSFYGGILASIIYLILLNRKHTFNLWQVTDTMILPFGFSFFIMRIGCFLNGCCYGTATTCIFGVSLPEDTFPSILRVFSSSLKIHPTQLYEGFGALFGVILLLLFRKHIRIKGQRTLYYGIYLTGLRFFVLNFRDLNYKPWVINIFYPTLYLTLMTMGFYLLYRLKKNNEIESFNPSVTILDNI